MEIIMRLPGMVMDIIIHLPQILAQAFSIGTISQGLLWSMMALGVYLTYRVLDIADLTVEGSFPLGAAVAASLIDGGRNPYFALTMATFAGMAAGVVTGLLHTKLKIPALLAGILSMIALYSINLHVMGKANVSLLRMDRSRIPGVMRRKSIIGFVRRTCPSAVTESQQ